MLDPSLHTDKMTFYAGNICTKMALLVLWLSYKHTLFQLSLCLRFYNFTNACSIIIELSILYQSLYRFKMFLTGMVTIHDIVHIVIECTNIRA